MPASRQKQSGKWRRAVEGILDICLALLDTLASKFPVRQQKFTAAALYAELSVDIFIAIMKVWILVVIYECLGIRR